MAPERRAHRRRIAVFVLVCGLLGAASASVSAAGADSMVFRLFLLDGTAVASYGEFARVGGRVVFSMPTGTGESPRLQVVSVPDSSVDWVRTDQYTMAVRAAQYAATRGEADYTALTATVARTLNLLSTTSAVSERLQIAERARSIVTSWGRDHYGYRAADVRQIGALLDEIVSNLRAEAGVNEFDLNLVAAVQPPDVPLLDAPTPQQLVEEILKVADATDVATDRVALLQQALSMLEQPDPSIPREWIGKTRRDTERAITSEKRAERAYGDLARTTLENAREAAARADPLAVERLMADVERRDSRLGNRRPQEVAGLMNAVRKELDTARRLRLARDHWRFILPALKQYDRLVRDPIREMVNARKKLDAIARLAGPDPESLTGMRVALGRAAQAVSRLDPPEELASGNATLASACQLALQAVGLREQAIRSGDLQKAWDASSAATGAAMLLQKARDQIKAALLAPELK